MEGASLDVTECDEYTWYGTTYTQSGTYTKVFPTPLGCDSTEYLHLSINYSPNPTEVYPVDPANIYPHWVVTATEFQINSYDFTISDRNSECHWDSVGWKFEDPNVRWLLEPDQSATPPGKTCRLYVLNHVADTIWLRATAYNQCKPQGETERYWFICSFYGTDDNTMQSEIGIMPNPNNGEMNIYFGDIEGSVNTSVYNMQGQIIDQFSLTTTPKNTYSYNLNGNKSGIYLFVFNYNGIIVTKKIIVTN